MKKIITIILSIASVTILLSAGITRQSSSWVAPALADTIKNPLIGDEASVVEGKKTYIKYCVICHGDKGKGDGLASAGLNPKPANHTTDAVQKQSDGAIFWKTTTGKPPMAGYEKMFTATQRWQLVNYIRVLKAK